MLLKRLLFGLTILLLPIAGKCINTDSLNRLVKSAADTGVIAKALAKGFMLLETDKDEAIQIADWSIEASTRLKQKDLLAYAHLLRGRLERRNLRYDQAIYHLLLALNLYEELHNSYKISSVCNSIAIIYMNLENYQKALKYERYALEQSSRLSPPNYKALTDINNQMGAACFELRKYDDAFRHFSNAYNAAVLGSDEQGMAIAMNNLTHIYLQQKKFDKALESATQSYGYAKKSGETATMAFNLSVIASIYLEKGEAAKAVKALKGAEKLAVSSSDHELKRTKIGRAHV